MFTAAAQRSVRVPSPVRRNSIPPRPAGPRRPHHETAAARAHTRPRAPGAGAASGCAGRHRRRRSKPPSPRALLARLRQPGWSDRHPYAAGRADGPVRTRTVVAATYRNGPTRAAFLSGEALAPLLTTGRDHAAAVLGRHPREKSVDPLAAAVVGLKRALHESAPNTKNAVEAAAPDCTLLRPPASSEESRDCEMFLHCPHVWTRLWKSFSPRG
jgi:hypothetical protein